MYVRSRHHRTFQHALTTVVLGLLCGALAGFGVTFVGWIGLEPEACCRISLLDPILGAALGAGFGFWAIVAKLRHEQDDDELRILSRKRTL